MAAMVVMTEKAVLRVVMNMRADVVMTGHLVAMEAMEGTVLLIYCLIMKCLKNTHAIIGQTAFLITR